MFYRKKPVVIEAFKVGVDTFPKWFIDSGNAEFYKDHSQDLNWHLIIKTLEGDMRADIGDWIIKGVKNEIYPCKNDVFEMTYEKVEK